MKQTYNKNTPTLKRTIKRTLLKEHTGPQKATKEQINMVMTKLRRHKWKNASEALKREVDVVYKRMCGKPNKKEVKPVPPMGSRIVTVEPSLVRVRTVQLDDPGKNLIKKDQIRQNMDLLLDGIDECVAIRRNWIELEMEYMDHCDYGRALPPDFMDRKKRAVDRMLAVVSIGEQLKKIL